jgi:hypothetical protein
MKKISRRRSFTSPSSTAGPPEPVFFVDADLSDRVFHQILEDAGIRFERHDDHFRQGTDDQEWLQEAGAKGWIVISHNKKIRRVSGQTERLMEAGVRAFMLIGDAYPNPPGMKSAFTRELADNFVRTLPAILRFLERYEGPWIAKLYRSASAGTAQPGSIKMWLTFQAWLKQR